jgi:hypothetical protein
LTDPLTPGRRCVETSGDVIDFAFRQFLTNVELYYLVLVATTSTDIQRIADASFEFRFTACPATIISPKRSSTR